MTNSKWQGNSDPDAIGELYRRIAGVEKYAQDLDRKLSNFDSSPPLSRVDTATYQNPYEGQRAIDSTDDEHTWYSNGQWRKATGGGKIAIGYYATGNITTNASGGLVNWGSPNESMAVSADYYGLTAGSDPQIKLPGVYAYHLNAVGLPTDGAGVTSELQMRIDVDAGSGGFWSPFGTSGAHDIERMYHYQGTAGDYYYSKQDVMGYAVWLPTDTFPVTVSVLVQYSRDSVGVAVTASFFLTFLRLGDADV